MNLQTTLIHGDARNIVDYLGPDSIDLIVTSPPYYNARDYSECGETSNGAIGRQDQCLKDYMADMRKVFEGCYRVLRDGCCMVLNISPVIDEELGRVNLPARLSLAMEDAGFQFGEDIIWVKPDGAAALRCGPFIQNKGRPRTYYANIVTEYIYVFYKGPKPQARKDGKWENYIYERTKQKGINTLDSYIDDRDEKSEPATHFKQWLMTNVWYFNPVTAKRVGHPAPYPPILPRLCIRLFSYEGETVLDPFVGSGTTMRAAQDLKRNAIGIEIEEHNTPLIKKHINYGGTTLFSDEEQRDFKIIEA